MSKLYNGHPSWAYWNVALWFGNDEGLYTLAKEWINRSKTKDQAAAGLYTMLTEIGQTETPDGAKYSRANIRHALKGL